MKSSLFDQLTRQYSTTISRRSMLRIFMALSFAPIISQNRIKRVLGHYSPEMMGCSEVHGLTGNCSGQPGGDDSSGFLARMRKPDYQFVSNDECGSGFTEPYIPDEMYGINLKPSCNAHDECYTKCGTTTKADCDRRFYLNILNECDRKYRTGLRRLACDNVAAALYWSGVHTFGGIPYANAQSEACQCCPKCGEEGYDPDTHRCCSFVDDDQTGKVVCGIDEQCCGNGSCCGEGTVCCPVDEERTEFACVSTPSDEACPNCFNKCEDGTICKQLDSGWVGCCDPEEHEWC